MSSTTSGLPPVLPSNYKPIEDKRFKNLVPQRCLMANGYYLDAYSGVLVTNWGFDKDKYYPMHIDRYTWEQISDIFHEMQCDYKIISKLPEGKDTSNFLEDLASRYFGLDIITY